MTLSSAFLTPEQIALGWRIEDDEDGPIIYFQNKEFARCGMGTTREDVQHAIGASPKPVS